MGFFSFVQEIAMDLGTANTIIISDAKTILLVFHNASLFKYKHGRQACHLKYVKDFRLYTSSNKRQALILKQQPKSLERTKPGTGYVCQITEINKNTLRILCDFLKSTVCFRRGSYIEPPVQ